MKVRQGKNALFASCGIFYLATDLEQATSVEYANTAGVVVCCIGIVAIIGTGGDFIPFFPDWAARYDVGLADAKEWKDNRWRFF